MNAPARIKAPPKRRAAKRTALKPAIPGLDKPAMHEINRLSTAIMEVVDSEIGFNVPGEDKPCDSACAARQVVRTKLREAALWSLAAIQDQDQERNG